MKWVWKAFSKITVISRKRGNLCLKNVKLCWPVDSKSSQRWKKAEIRNFHKFPFAGRDRPWFAQFFNCILGGVYQFCWCVRGKVEGGRRLYERRYLRTCSSLLKRSCPLQEDSSNIFTLFKVNFPNLSGLLLKNLGLQALVICMFEDQLYVQVF